MVMGIRLKNNNYRNVTSGFCNLKNDIAGLDEFKTTFEMKEQHMKGRVIQCQQGRN